MRSSTCSAARHSGDLSPSVQSQWLRTLCLFLLGALLLSAPPAEAHDVSWQLETVTFEDGKRAFGSFSYSSHTNTISSWIITVETGDPWFPAFAYTPDTSTAMSLAPTPGVPITLVFSATSPVGRSLHLATTLALPDGGDAVIPLSVSVTADSYECLYPCHPLVPAREIVAGSVSHLELERSIPLLSAPLLAVLASVLAAVALSNLCRNA